MCEVTAEPAPSVDWFKEGTPVSYKNTLYFIIFHKKYAENFRSDFGIYFLGFDW